MSVLGATIIPSLIISRLYNEEKKIVFAECGEIAKVVMNDGAANVEDGNRSQRSN